MRVNYKMKKNDYENYSVLMSVYKKEKAEYLKTSIKSMMDQSVPTNDFVLICDGPLTPELNEVINDAQRQYGEKIRVVRFEKNGGLGHALQVGVKECKNSIIARMDSDDISKPYRCEKELEVLMNHPEISIVGSVIEEFSTTPDIVDAKRVVPETNDEIISFSKTRNPFNHPSVMYRKEAVLRAGNYSNVRYMQDYYLWIDMLIAGMKGYNIQESLVWMRADSKLFKRRSGKIYVQIQIELFKKMYDAGYITKVEYLKSVFIRVCSALAPNKLRQFMFKKILRK